MLSTFSFPTTTLFGAGARRELRGRLTGLKCARPLVVTDAGLAGSEAFQLLGEALPGIEATLSAEVRQNPAEEDVERAFEAFRDKGCDGVIAFGGGSVLDVGKALRLRVKHPEKSLAGFDADADWTGLSPLIVIPTTAGTGSEVGRSAVIIMEDRKRVFFHPNLLADLVILDPEFTCGLPRHLTAATGADALTHCIESFTSPVFHPLCDGLALEGIHLIVGALPRAVEGELEARGLMQIAAAIGGIAFQKDLGAAHSLAHPLSALCGMHHGLANALCLPHVMEFNAARKPWIYRRVGLALGLTDPDATQTIAAVRALLESAGIRGGLRERGVDESHLDALTAQAFEDSCHATNPVPVTAEDLRNLYIEALD